SFLVTPTTLLRRHRQMIARRWTYAARNSRPALGSEIPPSRQPPARVRSLGGGWALLDAGRSLHGRPDRRLPRPLQPARRPPLEPLLGHPPRERGSRRGEHVTRAGTRLAMGAVLGLGLRKTYRLLASGELTLDLALGRRLQPLG